MTSLIQKMQDDKQEKEVAKAHEEALRMNYIWDSFYQSNKKARDALVSGAEGGQMTPGETMLVTYYRGKPVFGKRKTARGKIADIQYNEDGRIILKTGIFKKNHIPFSMIENAEYKPEIREAKEKEDKKIGEERDKLRQKKQAKESHLFGMANSASGIHLFLKKSGHFLEMGVAAEIINEICKHEGWEYIGTFGRGHSTGSGYGTLQCAGAFDGRRLIGGIGIYQEMSSCSSTLPKVVSDVYRFYGDREIDEVHPDVSSIVRIRDENLRKFIAGLYAGLYGDKVGEREEAREARRE